VSLNPLGGTRGRLFLMFVVTAFLPLALIALVSLTQLRGLLLHQGDQRLAANAKSYGMAVFDRLSAAGDMAGSGTHTQRVFQGTGRISPSGSFQTLSGDFARPDVPRRVAMRLADGKTTVTVISRPPVGATVLLFVPEKTPGSIFVGEVAPGYLWGPLDERPAETDFCVIEDSSRTVLHCEAVDGGGPLLKVADQVAPSGDTFQWRRNQEPQRARAWAQFLGAAFGTPDWVVVANQPEAHPLARLAEYQKIYIPSVVLALVLVTWFTIRQSSAIAEPLETLARRARELSRGIFHGRVGMKRDDEFGELATAMDGMSEQLGRQFASLSALSEMDSQILANEDPSLIIRTVVQRLPTFLTADFVTLTLVEREEKITARTYSVSSSEDAFLMTPQVVSEGELAAIGEAPAGTWVTLPLAETAPFHLAHPGFRGMSAAYVQPIVWRATTYGAIALGYRGNERAGADEIQRVREVADRMAVALSSAWRDDQIYRQAHYDPLTSLPNRLLFGDRLNVEMVRCRREGTRFALLMIDLDHFKGVNDSFGHSMGDLVLKEAAERIKGRIRATDTLARLGGDEFAVLLANLGHPQEAWNIAEAIVGEMSRAFQLREQRAFLSASVGIASFPEDGDNGETLLKSADTATYRAKAEGRAQAMFYEQRMNLEAVSRITLDRDMRAAIERGEMRMHYQPQVDMRTGKVVAAEALLRWFHPVRGLVGPAHFIPLAEESGFIDPLGQWIFEDVCAQVARWRHEGLVLESVAVNVSPRQFRRRNLVDQIAACVRASGLPASAIEIEITEGLLVDRGSVVEEMLHALADAGHPIALDDFGTGFSSMSYLERLPVSAIKIDRTFVMKLEQGGDSEAIVTAIIAMSRALGKRVIAEGVETQGQAQVLERLGCDRIQGYLISPAIAAEEFARFPREVPPWSEGAPGSIASVKLQSLG
jgi:diguanylate cyclase (GGDEF)-like protein